MPRSGQHAARSTRLAGLRAVRRSALTLVLALTVGLVAPSAAPAAAVEEPPPHVPPVDAPVTDPFRPPEHRWGSGNRGQKYDVEEGTAVRATGDGQVTFAGPVAGTLHVTVLHADGVRTSYSFLTGVSVRIGQRVSQGDHLGTAGAGFHLGARVGDTYFDPASLFSGGSTRVRLVPFDDPLPPGIRGERSALQQLTGGVGRLFGGAARWVVEETTQRLGHAGHYALGLHPVLLGGRLVRAANDAWVASRRECTPADQPIPPPAGRRVAVLVGGLGSSSEEASIDDLPTRAIGYADGDVIRFSYAGGRVPDATAGIAAGAESDYDAADTQADIRASAELLADLVEDTVSAAPGAQVDLLAHSQGGVVARLALAELDRRHGAEWLDRVGVLVTLGTPHSGADLATGAAAIGTSPLGRWGLDRVGEKVPLGFDPGSVSVGQLAETSRLVGELASTPRPAAVPVTSIAARGDVIVPAPRARAPGATNVTVPLMGTQAHAALPGSAAAAREVALAVAGMPPGCVGVAGAFLDRATGEVVSYVEDGAMAVVVGSLSAVGTPG